MLSEDLNVRILEYLDAKSLVAMMEVRRGSREEETQEEKDAMNCTETTKMGSLCSRTAIRCGPCRGYCKQHVRGWVKALLEDMVKSEANLYIRTFNPKAADGDWGYVYMRQNGPDGPWFYRTSKTSMMEWHAPQIKQMYATVLAESVEQDINKGYRAVLCMSFQNDHRPPTELTYWEGSEFQTPEGITHCYVIKLQFD